jgi:2-dehydro-3-deoxyphosphogalactonate aldolase
MVGAGTVLTPQNVRDVAAAGGKFIISPNTDVDVIKETKKLGMLSIPGFFTATEGFAAVKAGADYLKLFPACLGPSYVKDLKAVIKTPIMAVGGVNSDNIPDFMKVCCGVGIGSALYKAGKSITDIRRDAEEIVKAVKG